MLKCNFCQKEFKTKSGLINHTINCEKTLHLKDDVIKLYVKKLLSITEISKELKLTKSKIKEYLGDNVRNKSEANVIAHKRYPDNFKHDDKTKKILREKRLKYMKENPEKTAWRTYNLSYPEKLFLNKIKDIGWDKKYLIIREKSVFPFFIDFAFENEKVAVEIDGSQHLEEDRKNRDEIKDKLLNDLGWSIIRVSEKEIKTNINNCIDIILNILKNKSKPSKYIVGILKYPRNRNKYGGDRSKYFEIVRNDFRISIKPIIKKIESSDIDFSKSGWVKKVSKIIGCNENSGGKWVKKYMTDFYVKKCWVRNKKEIIKYCKCGKIIRNVSRQCIKCNNLSRKIERPKHDDLIKEIQDNGYSSTGRKYNVSHTTIRRWSKE